MIAMRTALFALIAPILVSSIGFEAQAQTAQPAATPAAAPAAAQPLLKAEELDQLMAPVALYPDTLLANVLMASTYPLEVVEADRWAKANKNLKNDQLKAAVDKQKWDDSVKQLAATPSVLDMMSSKLDWTQKLGDAVLAQQADVMDSVQRLRSRAQAEKKLTTTKEQKVTVKQESNKQVIVIEPAEPNTIYVPYYNPSVVYGAWPYPAYPPYYWPPAPGYYAGAAIATGLAFGAGVAVGAWAANNNWWGGGIGWGNNNIIANRTTNINVNNWTHNSIHRGGVRYNNANVQAKFGNNNIRANAQQRMDFRGHNGEQVIKPGGGDRAGNLANRGDRPGAGDRKAGDRPGGGDRKAGDRPGGGDRKAGNRPGGGDRKAGDRKPGNRPAGQRPGGGGGGGREHALGNLDHGRSAFAHADRGRASMGGHIGGGGQFRGAGGGGFRGGGGGFHGGGGRGGGFHGGGRRSDIRLKHDIALLGTLDNGLGFYRFAYNGSERAYVGVMAQEVQAVMPEAVARGRDGYLRVFYDKLGLKFETYERWIASGARIPAVGGTK
jgi:hypothetical protein